MNKYIKEFLNIKYSTLTPISSVTGYFDIDDSSGKTLAHISISPTSHRYDNLLHIHSCQMDELMSWFSIDRRIARIHIQNHIYESFSTKTVDELRSKFNNTTTKKEDN